MLPSACNEFDDDAPRNGAVIWDSYSDYSSDAEDSVKHLTDPPQCERAVEDVVPSMLEVVCARAREAEVVEPLEDRLDKIAASAEIESHLDLYILARPCEADVHLRPVIRRLLHGAGVKFSVNSAHFPDGATWTTIVWPTKTNDLADLVEATTIAEANGGRASAVVRATLDAVADTLHSIVRERSEVIRSNCTKNRWEVDGEGVGAVYLELTTEKGVKTCLPSNVHHNIMHVQTCSKLEWFLALALKPAPGDATLFDDLNGCIRSGTHAIEAVPIPSSTTHFRLSTRGLRADDAMLLDAGHDLSGITLDASLGTNPEVIDARALLGEWFSLQTDRLDFFLCSMAERLLLRVRKEAHVIEVASDVGKTALLMLIDAACGTYARVVPNDSISGTNRRTARIHEATLSKAGIRFILHDEVNSVDWEFLKTQSNGAPLDEWAVGMSNTMHAANKATRVLTRNVTASGGVSTASKDVRRKILHWNESSFGKPVRNPARHEKIKKKDPALARGVFLSMLEAFHRLKGERPDLDDGLRAGADLVESVPDADINDLTESLDALTMVVRSAYHELFRDVGPGDDGTSAEGVKAAIAARFGDAATLTQLPLEYFTNFVLRTGEAVDSSPMIPKTERCYVTGADGKRFRPAKAMRCQHR